MGGEKKKLEVRVFYDKVDHNEEERCGMLPLAGFAEAKFIMVVISARAFVFRNFAMSSDERSQHDTPQQFPAQFRRLLPKYRIAFSSLMIPRPLPRRSNQHLHVNSLQSSLLT